MWLFIYFSLKLKNWQILVVSDEEHYKSHYGIFFSLLVDQLDPAQC